MFNNHGGSYMKEEAERICAATLIVYCVLSGKYAQDGIEKNEVSTFGLLVEFSKFVQSSYT